MLLPAQRRTHHTPAVLLFDRPLIMHSPHPDTDTQDSLICARETFTLAINERYRFLQMARINSSYRWALNNNSFLMSCRCSLFVRSVPASVIVQGL